MILHVRANVCVEGGARLALLNSTANRFTQRPRMRLLIRIVVLPFGRQISLCRSCGEQV